MSNLQHGFTKEEFLEVVRLLPTLRKMEKVLIGIEPIMQRFAENRLEKVPGKHNQVHRGLLERDCLFRSFLWLGKHNKHITFNAGFGFWKTEEGRKHHLYVDFFIPRDENNGRHSDYANKLKKELPDSFQKEDYKDFCRVYDERHLDKFLEEKGNPLHIETMTTWLKTRIEQVENIELIG